MKIADLLSIDCIRFLSARDKASAMAEMAEMTAKLDSSLEPEPLLKALEHRESLMSTGMGQGIAVPHVRLAEINSPIMSIGISKAGIGDYQALDSQPVHIMVMIAAPNGQHELYLQLLAQAMGKIRDQATRQSLLDASEPQEVLELLVK